MNIYDMSWGPFLWISELVCGYFVKLLQITRRLAWQLIKRLRSEDIPLRLMIIHTTDSKSKQDKVNATNLKILPKFPFVISTKTLHGTHFLKLLDKMCRHEMDLSSIVDDTERTILSTDVRSDADSEGHRSDGLVTLDILHNLQWLCIIFSYCLYPNND